MIKTARHVSAVVEGTIHDTFKPDPFRCVYGAWQLTRDAGQSEPSTPSEILIGDLCKSDCRQLHSGLERCHVVSARAGLRSDDQAFPRQHRHESTRSKGLLVCEQCRLARGAAAVAAAFERLSGETQRITATGFEEEMSTVMHSRRSRRT